MFICPNCRGRLTRTQNELGVYWVCPECSGRAVSLAVLRKAVAAEFVYRVWSAARDGVGATGRRCPTCDQRMLEVAVSPAEDSLKLDVCKRCQFVWFDPGELESAPPAPPQPRKADECEESRLPQEAREALAIYQAQQIGVQARAEDPSPDASWKTIPALFGLPVESETQPLQHVPWLTWSLAAVIAVVSIWAFSDLENIINHFGLVPAEVWRHGGVTPLTSFFLHGGIWHLAGNLYFLLIFGDNVEDWLGRWRFLLLLLLATLTGDALHVLGEPHSTTPCVGASGGISGLIALYALKFPHAKLGFLFRFFWFFSYFRWFQLPAWGAFCLWLVLQVWGAYEQLAGFSNVSALAHLGGVFVAFLFWLKWRKL